MSIEKYTIFVKDLNNKKNFKFIIEEDCPWQVHKKAYDRTSNYQEISKITDHEGTVVYDINAGFKV
jgi:hypothetical protein